MFTDDKFLQVCERWREIHEGKPLAALTARYGEVLDRTAGLESYARRSNGQDDELDQLGAERTVLDVAIGDAKMAARSQLAAERAGKIAEITRAAQDPANLERPVGAPPLVKGLGDRRETGAEVLQRMGRNPWRREDGAPLTRGETGAGLISRAHTALEGLEDTLTRDGCGKLAEAMAEESTWPGVMMKRSKQEQADAAALWLALSNPAYSEAFRAAIRYPGEFMGSGGTGFETLSDDQGRHGGTCGPTSSAVPRSPRPPARLARSRSRLTSIRTSS
jgi:hypothetical protein